MPKMQRRRYYCKKCSEEYKKEIAAMSKEDRETYDKQRLGELVKVLKENGEQWYKLKNV